MPPAIARASVRPKNLAGQIHIGVSSVRAPTLNEVIEEFFGSNGVDDKGRAPSREFGYGGFTDRFDGRYQPSAALCDEPVVEDRLLLSFEQRRARLQVGI